MNQTNHHISKTKEFRQELDTVLQSIRYESDRSYPGERNPHIQLRSSRERSIAITKLQEAIMWLGMDLKAINEEIPGASPTPYPQSYNPQSTVIEPTADNLKL